MTVEPQMMTKTEREELKRLARERARVAKADAARRTADLKASFEEQVVAHYDYDREEVWDKAYALVKDAVGDANDVIAGHCEDIGIPRQFAPSISFEWHRRQPQWAVQQEQDGLRRVAYKRLDAMERTAKHEIDRKALEIQTQLVRSGLTSDQAIGFLDGMPTVEALMPEIDLRELTAGNRPQGDDLEF